MYKPRKKPSDTNALPLNDAEKPVFSRRDIFGQMALASLWPLSLISCAKSPPITSPVKRPEDYKKSNIQIDGSFAEMVLGHYEEKNPNYYNSLLKHPGLQVICEHKHMTSGKRANRRKMLDQILSQKINVQGLKGVLDYWKCRQKELISTTKKANAYLPPNAPSQGTLHFITGYDIGIATPRSAAVNAAHSKFSADPREIAYFALHEMHHVGFLKRRPFPDLARITEVDFLKKLIIYFTHMEGMAVHAAYLPRARNNQLHADEDYRIYIDPNFTKKVLARYRQVFNLIPQKGRCSNKRLGFVLNAMSSGERLWYQLGAFTCSEIERSYGRTKLIQSVEDPDIFRSMLKKILSS